MTFRPTRTPLWLALTNLALLALYPVAWLAPLARAGVLPFFSGSELTVLGGVRDLWPSDPALSLLVAFFAVVAPWVKTALLALIHFDRLKPGRWTFALEIMGKLSMADVFLLAFYILAIKGVGVGYVKTAWGLWLFTGLVLVSFGVSIITARSTLR